MNSTRASYKWISVIAASLLAVAVAGCSGGGGGGDNNAAAPPPAGGGGGGGGAPTVPVPTGSAPITLTASTPPATFAAMTLAVPAISVSIASAPKVTFSLTDGNGNAVIGFGSTSKSATATAASYPNLSFALAKMVPGTGTAPSRWVSYIVTTVPSTTTAATATRPSTDNTGTLVDNKNGTYTYTFFRDITTVKAQVAAMTLTGVNNAADLDDLTYDPSLVHRLTIQISGNAPGTGTNTPNAVQTTPGVVMANPVNAIFDFTPATGQAVTASGRDIAATAKCNECHQNLGGFPEVSDSASDATFHGGSRNKVEYCVVCHTDQRKFGRAEAVVLANGNYDAVRNPVDFPGPGPGTLKSGAGTYRINGLAVGMLATHIHKIHMSSNLLKKGYEFGGIAYEEACKFPQDVRNCTKCHDGSATSTAKTAQGDNWMKVPSRMACGACHDGINFITGKGQSLNGEFPGHIGGAQADDSKCALCHDAVTIPVNHIPVTPPDGANALLAAGTASNTNTNAAFIASNTSRVPAGAIAVTYEINSVSRNASKQPVIVFRLLQNGARKDFNVFTPPATSSKEIWDNFMGAPSLYFVFAVPQDGINAPADFNASVNVYLRSLWNGTATGTGAGTLTGPDANGFYTATLTGAQIPDSAVMLTGGVGYTYNVLTALPLTQTNLADFPVTAAPGAPGATLVATNSNKTGGLIVVAPNVQKVATGYTARRAIVEDARCNKCHQELGLFTDGEFHAGQRNDGTTCSWCHNPNKTSSGWSADSISFVHGIHAAAKLENNFTWHASSTTDGFWKIGYPGILNNCETCHVPGMYDFSAPTSSSALPNRLYRTVATGKFNRSGPDPVANFALSPYITADNVTDYGAGFAFNVGTGATTPAAGTTLVSSPIATACFACHDSALARGHMENEGGSIYKPRTAALAKVELCMQCHSPTSAFGLGIKEVHAR